MMVSSDAWYPTYDLLPVRCLSLDFSGMGGGCGRGGKGVIGGGRMGPVGGVGGRAFAFPFADVLCTAL